MDILFVNPGNASGIYQKLSNKYSAIEPPTWSLLLAESCRSVGYKVGIIDANAESLTHQEVVDRVNELSPRLICFVVYGQNVNAGTVNMAGATSLSSYMKQVGVDIPISYVGSHIQALPTKTMQEEDSIDFGFTNEGVYALRNVLSLKHIDVNDLSNIKGVVWRHNGKVQLNVSEKVVPNSMMDVDLPGYAWDLLPFKEKPLDLYRSPMWHAHYDQSKRSPYAAIQTSLGCQFSCNFCMINILNRDDEQEVGSASDYSSMRHWSPEFIINEFEKLIDLGVTTIKITDEMFLLKRKYYTPLCEMLRDRGHGKKLMMWAYSRIDTVRRPETLKLLADAGIKWLALGIESADKKVRLEVSKGKFEDVDIEKVIEQVHQAGIDVMANYIFGLPGDTKESMQKTLDLSIDLCTLGWNAYAAMALPGSQLYRDALRNNLELPDTYQSFSFHSYDTLPLANENLTSPEILKFRDDAFIKYHTNEKFLDKVQKKYGTIARSNLEDMCKVRLKRKILGDQWTNKT